MPSSGEPATSLNDQAFDRLRAEIIGCRLAPGRLLSERKLAEQLGLGMAAIRVALVRLDQLGLVRAIPRRGYQVLPLTEKSVDDLFDFWSVIGPELVARAADGDQSDLEQAIAYARELADMNFPSGPAPSAESVLPAVETGERLFELLAAMTGNQYLIDANHRIIGEVMRAWTLVVQSELQEAGHRVPNFDECIDALRCRDSVALAEWMRAHVQRSHERVRRTLSRWPVVAACSAGVAS